MKVGWHGRAWRHFAAGAAGGLLLLSGGLAHARGTRAFDVWCYDDPVILVDGVPQSITVGLPQSDVSHLVGPVVVVVAAPNGHTVTEGPAQPGPFQVVIAIVPSANAHDRSPVVHITTFVPADARFDVTVTVTNGNGYSKTSHGTSLTPIHTDFNPLAGH
jgi:hypothetical protein